MKDIKIEQINQNIKFYNDIKIFMNTVWKSLS